MYLCRGHSRFIFLHWCIDVYAWHDAITCMCDVSRAWHDSCVWGSFLAEKFPERGPGLEWGTVTKCVTSQFRHKTSHSSFDVTLPGFKKVFFSTSKNVTISLELGTNVTISSLRHIIFLGSAWNKPDFQNMARSWVLGSRFSNSGNILEKWQIPREND